MAAATTEADAPVAKPDGTRAEYGRVWLHGRKVSAKTYATATGGSVPEPKPKPPAAAPESGDNPLAVIAAALQAMSAKADDKAEQQTALAQLGSIMAKLDFKNNPDLLKNPDVTKFMEMVADAQVDTAPGRVRGGETIGEGWNATKKPWTPNDLDGNEVVEYTPRETVQVVYNGIPYQFFEDVTVRVRKCFVDQAEYRRQQLRSTHEHAKHLFKAGAVDPRFLDPTILGRPEDQQGFRTRAQVTNGVFLPGAGGMMLPPDQETFDLATKLDGDAGDDGGDGGDGE